MYIVSRLKRDHFHGECDISHRLVQAKTKPILNELRRNFFYRYLLFYYYFSYMIDDLQPQKIHHTHMSHINSRNSIPHWIIISFRDWKYERFSIRVSIFHPPIRLRQRNDSQFEFSVRT